MKKSISLLVVLMSFLLSGCAYNASNYGASVKNVEAIKTKNIQPVSVAQFTSSSPGKSTIVCRAAGPVTINPSFESYIERAFIDELKLAGAYDPNSNIKLSGKLEEIDFSSGMTDGNWAFTLTLSNNKSESYATKSSYGFSGSFVADKACQEVAQAFSPAVQKLIEDVVQNPKFREIAK
ncbi:MAG TPA: hypothetical protein VJ654_01515 [Noviherbaspirillum sp.]|nr:hypothetical protein [Noviherbaspirillum sp.]